MFLVVPRSDEHVGFERPFFARPIGREILLVGRLERTLSTPENMLNFDFIETGMGLVYPPYFVYDFSKKLFHMLYSIN